MKKKTIIISAVVGVILLAVLFVPMPPIAYEDGGTKEYRALTYKVIKWQRDGEVPNGTDGTYISGFYTGTRVHWFADSYKSVSELWEEDKNYLDFKIDENIDGGSNGSVVYDGKPTKFGASEISEGSELSLFSPTSDIGVPVLGEKTVKGGTADFLSALLADCKPSGEKAGKLSDRTYDDIYEIYQNITRDIWLYMWVEHDGVLYRVEPDGRICIVDEYLSEGEYLDLDKKAEENDLIGQLKAAEAYYPYDYWVGIYKNETLTVRHVYQAESDVSFTVVDVDINDDFESPHSITLDIVSKNDTSAEIYLDSTTGGCVVYAGDSVMVNLKAGTPQRHTLHFNGSGFYFVKILADNTVLSIDINPDHD